MFCKKWHAARRILQDVFGEKQIEHCLEFNHFPLKWNHFLHVLKQEPWEVMEKIIRPVNDQRIPINFLITEDTQNVTAFHVLANPPKECGKFMYISQYHPLLTLRFH